MVPYLFELNLDNAQYMDLPMYPIYIGCPSMMQPWPKEESHLNVIIRPFDILVITDFHAY